MKSFQFKRTQRRYKTHYRIANWSAYEAGLRQRGSVILWLNEDAKKAWFHTSRRKPGGNCIYSETAIKTFWMISMIYRLPLRQTEGFIKSLFVLTAINLPIPDHSTVSRRMRALGKIPIIPRNSKSPIHLLIDSSGLRIHIGQSRKLPKRRAWRKIHLAVDRKTGDIMAAELTASNAHDGALVPGLLDKIKNKLASFSGDGAYDKEAVYKAVQEHSPGRQTRVIIPPQKDAVLSPENRTAMQERNRHIRSINRIGRRKWHLRSGFSKRSIVENVFHRYKTILGRELKARTLSGQRVEAQIGCQILNTMAKLGMPESYPTE